MNISNSEIVPSTCRPEDVEKLLRHKLAKQPFSYRGEITCDTAAGNSFSNRLMNMTWGQTGAVMYVISIMGLVYFATNYDLVNIIMRLTIEKRIEDYIPIAALSTQMSNFSFFQNVKRLVTVKKGEETLNTIDKMKIGVVFFGLLGHCISCFETPLGMYLIHRIHDTPNVFGSLLMQPMFNLNIMSMLSFIGGAMTLMVTYDLINDDMFSFSNAIFLKWMRYAPSVISVIALDFVWPLLGDGPLFSRISKIVLEKCTRNWWTNIFALGNARSSVENCAPHTFYMSVDLQLFVLGLIVVFLLTRKALIGCIAAIGFAACGHLMLFANAKSLISPVFMDKDTSVTKTLSYIDTVHTPTYSHMPDYFIGLLVAYLLKESIIRGTYLKSMIASLLITALKFGLYFSPALHNVYHKIPPQYYAHFIVASKMAFTLLFATMYINFYEASKSTEEKKDKNDSTDTKGNNNDDSVPSLLEDGMTISMSKAIVKLSFSIYMINYFFIRYDFFTSRLLYVIDFYNILKRLIYTVFYTVLVALIFHLNFVSPFESVRKTMNISIVKRPIWKDKDE